MRVLALTISAMQSRGFLEDSGTDRAVVKNFYEELVGIADLHSTTSFHPRENTISTLSEPEFDTTDFPGKSPIPRTLALIALGEVISSDSY
jgi:hypothetical protein